MGDSPRNAPKVLPEMPAELPPPPRDFQTNALKVLKVTNAEPPLKPLVLSQTKLQRKPPPPLPPRNSLRNAPKVPPEMPAELPPPRRDSQTHALRVKKVMLAEPPLRDSPRNAPKVLPEMPAELPPPRRDSQTNALRVKKVMLAEPPLRDLP